MADGYQNIFKSDLFTFLVGEDKKPIIVHSAAITAHSKALSALVNNGMAESQTRTAALDDIGEDDFLRFCQFAYTGDYSTPLFVEDQIPPVEDEQISEPLSVVPPPPPPPPPALPDDEAWAMPVRSAKKSKKTRGGTTATHSESGVWSTWGINVSQREYRSPNDLRTTFQNRKFFKESPHQKFIDSCEPLRNSHPNHNYTPVFLAHCRLYVLADKYGIKTLRQLVLHKLRQTLLMFELYPERIQDVVELVRYAYTDDYTFSGGNDELRALVTIYAVLNIDKLDRSDSFLALLEDGGPFVRNFWMLVRNALYF